MTLGVAHRMIVQILIMDTWTTTIGFATFQAEISWEPAHQCLSIHTLDEMSILLKVGPQRSTMRAVSGFQCPNLAKSFKFSEPKNILLYKQNLV